LRLKCTKFDFGWGSAPELTALPRSPSWILRSPTSKGGEGREGKGKKKKREGKGEMGREEEGEGKGREGILSKKPGYGSVDV